MIHDSWMCFGNKMTKDFPKDLLLKAYLDLIYLVLLSRMVSTHLAGTPLATSERKGFLSYLAIGELSGATGVCFNFLRCCLVFRQTSFSQRVMIKLAPYLSYRNCKKRPIKTSEEPNRFTAK